MSNKKVTHSLVAMSAAAVLAVYSAGYVRTQPAANRLTAQALERNLARQGPVNEAPAEMNPRPVAPDVSTPAAPSPPSDPKPIRAGKPSSAPKEAIVPVPVETPAPVAAPAPAPASETFIAPPQPEVPAAAPVEAAPTVLKDGKYSGWGGSRHGDIQATIVIEAGRIVSAEISDCQTRYPCDIIEKLPPQVIKRQSYKVDRVGGATESADAFYYAVLEALKQAK
jgi:uncharacterized protein with FMN-binding domain